MLRSVRDLLGNAIIATDGDIGQATDLYFDDEKWTVRYLVVDAGGWLTGRSVLVSPMAIKKADWDNKQIDVALTKEQVTNSPGIDTAQPVSRQWETEYSRYYRWPYYWAGPGLWGAWPTPIEAAGAPYVPPSGPISGSADATSGSGDSHLQSAKEVIGYEVQARDGYAGSIEDFLVDDVTWTIKHIMVDTTSWWPGGEVLVAPERAQRVEWRERQVYFAMTREEIQTRPEYRPSGPTDH